MKSKNLIVAIIIVVVALAVIFIAKPFKSARPASKTVPAKQDKVKAKAAATVPEKKKFQKGMGGLTVKTKNSKGADVGLRLKAFMSDSGSSSVFVATFSSSRMQELAPGTYDVEIDTLPAKIFKNIKVSDGKETIEDLGAITGSVNVKGLNSKKKDMYASFKVMYPKSNLIAASGTMNRPIEVIPGVYNIAIETTPRQTKNDVKVECGKEMVIDLGVVSGALSVKAVDDTGNVVRLPVKIKASGVSTVAASGITNTSMEVTPGTYDVEVMSRPSQIKKEVKVAAGEDIGIEFTVNPPALPPAKAQQVLKKK